MKFFLIVIVIVSLFTTTICQSEPSLVNTPNLRGLLGINLNLGKPYNSKTPTKSPVNRSPGGIVGGLQNVASNIVPSIGVSLTNSTNPSNSTQGVVSGLRNPVGNILPTNTSIGLSAMNSSVGVALTKTNSTQPTNALPLPLPASGLGLGGIGGTVSNLLGSLF